MDTNNTEPRIATHRCKVCGALWRLIDIGWNLITLKCGPCCYNANMGEHIEKLNGNTQEVHTTTMPGGHTTEFRGPALPPKDPTDFGKLTAEQRAHWDRVGGQLVENSPLVERMIRQGQSPGNITQAELERQFADHPPQGTQLQRYAAIRAAALLFAQTVVLNTRRCADQVATIRMIRQAAMSANSTIACNEEYNDGPRDVVDVIEQHKLDLRESELARDQAILERDQWKQRAEQSEAVDANKLNSLQQQASAWVKVYEALKQARPRIDCLLFNNGTSRALGIVDAMRNDCRLLEQQRDQAWNERDDWIRRSGEYKDALDKERELRKFNAALAEGNLDAWMWQVWMLINKPGYKIDNQHMLQQLVDKYRPKVEVLQQGPTVRP